MFASQVIIELRKIMMGLSYNYIQCPFVHATSADHLPVLVWNLFPQPAIDQSCPAMQRWHSLEDSISHIYHIIFGYLGYFVVVAETSASSRQVPASD
jgi:hypothetical protein